MSIVAEDRTPDRTEPRRTQSRGSVSSGFGSPTFMQTKSVVESSAKFHLACLLGLNPKRKEAQRRPKPKGNLRPSFSLMQTVSQQPGVGSYAVRGWVLSGIQSWHFGFGVSRVESSGLGPLQIGVGSSSGFSPVHIAFGVNKE